MADDRSRISQSDSYGSDSARLASSQKARITGWIEFVNRVRPSRIPDKLIIGMEAYLHLLLKTAADVGVDRNVIIYIRQAKNYLSSAVWLIENEEKRPPDIYEYIDKAVEALEWALQFDSSLAD